MVITQKSFSGSTIKPRSHHINEPVRRSRRRIRKPRNCRFTCRRRCHPVSLGYLALSPTRTPSHPRKREKGRLSPHTSRARARTHPHTRTHGNRVQVGTRVTGKERPHRQIRASTTDPPQRRFPLPSGADTSSRHPLPFASGEFPPRGSRITRVDSAHCAGQRVISTRGPAPTYQ